MQGLDPVEFAYYMHWEHRIWRREYEHCDTVDGVALRGIAVAVF